MAVLLERMTGFCRIAAEREPVYSTRTAVPQPERSELFSTVPLQMNCRSRLEPSPSSSARSKRNFWPDSGSIPSARHGMAASRT